ncbi:MAG: DUF962 domain-containing protein [Dongiaceae bacterium]
MTFEEFWPHYLRAHRLPGTRGLHYFATALGIMSTIEAVICRQPLVFVVGVAIGYVIAIGAHWFVERNQPLIAVNAFWGALADLRLCWLALTGQMGREMMRHGIVQPTTTGDAANVRGVWRVNGPLDRYALLGASIVGAAAALADLVDLADPLESLPLPLVQLGMPILTFAAALIAAAGVLLAHKRPSSSAGSVPRQTTLPADERSLGRACFALLGFGLTAFATTELIEGGLSHGIHLAGGLAMLAMLLFALALLIRVRAARGHLPA